MSDGLCRDKMQVEAALCRTVQRAWPGPGRDTQYPGKGRKRAQVWKACGVVRRPPCGVTGTEREK